MPPQSLKIDNARYVITVDQLVRPDGDRDLAMLDKLIADCFNSQDYQEGVKAFSEKRRPQFQGR